MTTTITTTAELLSAIYASTSHGVTRTGNPDGDTIFRNDNRFFAIAQELEADGETLWGWTWGTGVYDDARGVMEHWSAGASQDAAEALAAAVRHLGAIEDNR